MLTWRFVTRSFYIACPDYVNTGGCPTGHSGSGTYGENLYWSSGSTTTLVPAVDAWHSEEPYWSCQNNDCQSGESTNPPKNFLHRHLD